MTLLTPLLAEITWPVVLLAIAFVFICLFMMMIILIQKPKGGGLSGAFGGAGGGESSFVGAKVGDMLTIVTVVCFVAFLGLAMALTWKINPTENQAKADVAASAPASTTTGAAGGEATEDATVGESDADIDIDDTEVMEDAQGEAESMIDPATEAAEAMTEGDAAPVPAEPPAGE